MASRAEERKRWGEVLNQWRASGQSMAAFCREQRLDCRRLRRWCKRLDGAQNRRLLTLIPVVPPTSKHAVPAVPKRLGDSAAVVGVRIRLPGDIAIDVQEGFDPKVLLSVVELLREKTTC